jgi:hypothetical protein
LTAWSEIAPAFSLPLGLHVTYQNAFQGATQDESRYWCRLKSTGLETAICLWDTNGMKMPNLQITKWHGMSPVEALCSSCRNAISTFISARPGNPGDNLAELKAAFDRHFKEVHMREDASQSAARVLREATEDE